MLTYLLVIFAVVCGLQAVRARQLLMSALWLAAVSALVALLLYRMGAYQVAVIELSVGAGLVTILFVFAVAMAGEDAMEARPIVPLVVAVSLIVITVALASWFAFPVSEPVATAEEVPFSTVLWQERGLDVLVQIGLIFAGVLGVLGLLSREEPLPVHDPAPETTERVPAPGGEPVPVRVRVREEVAK